MAMEIDDSPSTVYQATFDYTDSDVAITFDQNDTQVMCCLNGPAELPMSKRVNDKLAISVLYYLENGGPPSKELQTFAEIMIDRPYFPRAGLSINLYQMRDNGSRLSTALNALSLSLLDSAIPLDVLFGAVDVALMVDNSIIVTPTKDTENKAVATALLVFKQSKGELQVCGFQSKGTITADFYCGAVDAATPEVKHVFENFKSCMESRLRQTSTF